MGRTFKSDSSSGDLRFGNGSSVITPAFPLLDLGKFSRTSDFFINPPNVKIDADIRKIVMRESERLRLKPLKYTNVELDWQLKTIMKSADGPKDEAKKKLMREGKSAVIAGVSKALNASSIDHTSKFLLSHEPLFVYALSYAIYNEKVIDAEGLDDRIIVITENKIKPFFNKLIVKKFISDNHLNISKEQRKKIYKAAATTNISYLHGEPVKAINKIISKYVDYGNLNILVDKFFESGIIDKEKGSPQVRQLMVKYLVDIGLTLSASDLNPRPSPTGPGISSPSATSAGSSSPGSGAGAGPGSSSTSTTGSTPAGPSSSASPPDPRKGNSHGAKTSKSV